MNNNNIEVEAKILDVSHELLQDKIKLLGGKKIFQGILDARWLENSEGKKVRVRKEGDKTVVEYKEKINDGSKVKKAIEIGYEVDNFDNQIEVFKKLGFLESSKNIKKRISYILTTNDFGKIQFDIDKYIEVTGTDKKIPTLLEIEAENEEYIIKVAEILGYNKKDLKDWNLGELVEYYGKIK